MGKTIHRLRIPKVHRDGGALAAKMRKSAIFHDRRDPRGGSRNLQAEFLDEDFDDLDEVG